MAHHAVGTPGESSLQSENVWIKLDLSRHDFDQVKGLVVLAQQKGYNIKWGDRPFGHFDSRATVVFDSCFTCNAAKLHGTKNVAKAVYEAWADSQDRVSTMEKSSNEDAIVSKSKSTSQAPKDAACGIEDVETQKHIVVSSPDHKTQGKELEASIGKKSTPSSSAKVAFDETALSSVRQVGHDRASDAPVDLASMVDHHGTQPFETNNLTQTSLMQAGGSASNDVASSPVETPFRRGSRQRIPKTPWTPTS